MKSKLQKSRDNPRSRLWLRKADAAWGQWVHAHYRQCAINNGHCSGNLEAHHFISRAVKVTRHAPENGILLCSLHHVFSNHLSPHGAPLQFAEWLMKNQPDRWAWVQDHKNDWKLNKADFKAAYERLINEISKN